MFLQLSPEQSVGDVHRGDGSCAILSALGSGRAEEGGHVPIILVCPILYAKFTGAADAYNPMISYD